MINDSNRFSLERTLKIHEEEIHQPLKKYVCQSGQILIQ